MAEKVLVYETLHGPKIPQRKKDSSLAMERLKALQQPVIGTKKDKIDIPQCSRLSSPFLQAKLMQSSVQQVPAGKPVTLEGPASTEAQSPGLPQTQLSLAGKPAT
jgi:hypothetical protein